MMRTIALRFSNIFAPECGTIKAHEELIALNGFVWYGKLGSKVSAKVEQDILANPSPRILLIHSGSTGRYWAHIDKIQSETPPLQEIPAYYRDRAEDFASWFRVLRIEDAAKNVLSQCYVASSGASLSIASRHSMNPYFIIDYKAADEFSNKAQKASPLEE